MSLKVQAHMQAYTLAHTHTGTHACSLYMHAYVKNKIINQ